jgi:hypothetical protein
VSTDGEPLNRIRREIVIWYALAVALACLWVPWRGPVSANLTTFLGYGGIWSGPTGARAPEYYKLATIDYGRLALELLGLTAVACVAFLAMPGRVTKRPASVSKSEPTTIGTSMEHPADASPGAKQQHTGMLPVGKAEANPLSIRATERQTYRRALWPQCGIFVGGAILTIVVAGYAFGLSADAVRILTTILLRTAVGAIVLSYAVGGRWLTTKRACAAALLLYGGVLIWILTIVSGSQHAPH